MASETETELKFTLTQGEFDRLVGAFPPREILHQVNVYFDTPTGNLSRARWALRLRSAGDRKFLTAKGPGQLREGMVERPEIEVEISNKEAESLLAGRWSNCEQLKPLQAVQDLCQGQELQNFLTFENTRRVCPWRHWTLEIDHAQCAGQHLLELEIECSSSDGQNLKRELRQLFAGLGLDPKPSKINKLEWARRCTCV